MKIDDYTLCPERNGAGAVEHACPDWDFLVIKPGSREMECCTCFTKENSDRKDGSVPHTNGRLTLLDKPAPSYSDYGWRALSMPSQKILAVGANNQFLADDNSARERAEHNARRLVACWNACLGMDTATLELAGSGNAPDVKEWFEDSCDRHGYELATAELIAALRATTEALQNISDYWAYGMNKSEGAQPTPEDDAAATAMAVAARKAIDKSNALLAALEK